VLVRSEIEIETDDRKRPGIQRRQTVELGGQR